MFWFGNMGRLSVSERRRMTKDEDYQNGCKQTFLLALGFNGKGRIHHYGGNEKLLVLVLASQR
jgi:hypothetical protein